MKRVMAIGAHPDDIEFGCGGTLIKHNQNGDETFYLCMTGTESVDGVTGDIIRTKDQNQIESLTAYNVLGCEFFKILSNKDLHLEFNFTNISSVEKLIKQYDIDTIYTHWSGDANQDHIATFNITMAAARYVPNVFCYEQIPISRMGEHTIDVNYYVDITDTFEKKIEASLCHKSQIEKYKKVGFDVKENLETMAKYRGIQAQCKYAEAFKSLKIVV